MRAFRREIQSRVCEAPDDEVSRLDRLNDTIPFDELPTLSDEQCTVIIMLYGAPLKYKLALEDFRKALDVAIGEHVGAMKALRYYAFFNHWYEEQQGIQS